MQLLDTSIVNLFRILILNYLEYLVLVTLEAVELELEVPEVPERHGLVGGAGGEDELGVGVETQTVHLRSLTFNQRKTVNNAAFIFERKKVADQIILATVHPSPDLLLLAPD